MDSDAMLIYCRILLCNPCFSKTPKQHRLNGVVAFLYASFKASEVASCSLRTPILAWMRKVIVAIWATLKSGAKLLHSPQPAIGMYPLSCFVISR